MIDLGNIDYFVVRAIQELEGIDLESVDKDEIFLDSFTTTLSDGTVTNLCVGGRDLPVYYRDIPLFATALSNVRMCESEDALRAIRRGIDSIVPHSLLSIFSWHEVEAMVRQTLFIFTPRLLYHYIFLWLF